MDQFQYIGPLGIPMTIMSLIAFAIIIERIWFYIKLPSVENCKYFANMCKILDKNKKQPKNIRDELVCFLLIENKRSYDFGVRILRIVAVTSPMLGLLGTVLGIISSFKKISLHDGPVYPALIADGLWTAMLTTALGLIIALPCLFAAFIFARKAEKRMEIYQSKLNKLSLRIEGVEV